jgi:uncharacterized damage-inducible protein DinB
MDAAYFRVLFDYNGWANERVLARAGELTEAEYSAVRPGLSFGSLHATLAHAFAAEGVWLGRWRGAPLTGPLANAREMGPILETEVPTLSALRERWQAVEAGLQEFVARLSDAEAQAPLRYVMTDGSAYEHPLAEQLAHLVNHGTQFRSEAAVALTQAGHSPGDLDLIGYLRQR